MTYKELYEKAIWLLEHNEINGKEYDKMIEPLNAEVGNAEPVRHGKWILEQEEYDGYGYGNWNRWRCSCCGYVRTKGWATTSEGHKPKAMLCEKCGAKMDEERKEE